MYKKHRQDRGLERSSWSGEIKIKRNHGSDLRDLRYSEYFFSWAS